MSALVAIFSIFTISALGVLAALVYFLRQRMLQEPKPRRVKPRRAKKRADGTAEPEPEPAPVPLKQGRSRLISASSLAEAEAANTAPESALIEPAPPEPEPAPLAPEPERPSPLAAAARQAIVFHQYFPPHLGAESRSFYGGTPYVPGVMEWPRDAASGKPLHFILQVDLAAVPEEARLGLLPESGVLAFFIDLTWGPGQAYRVVWQQGYEGMPWHDIAPPDDLAMAYGDIAAYSWPWALTPEQGIPLLPRWPFEPVLVPLPEPPVPAEDEWVAGPPAWPMVDGVDAIAAALLRAQDPDCAGPALQEPLRWGDFCGPDGAPWEGFPQNWLSVQIASAALVREADSHLRSPQGPIYSGMDDAQRTAQLKLVREEAQAWFDHALGNPAFGPVGAPVRKAFWDWYAGHKELAWRVAPRAVEDAIETMLHASPQQAAEIPPELVARLAQRHVLDLRVNKVAGEDVTEKASARVPNRMLAPYSNVQSDQTERAEKELLLLELSANRAIGHYFAEAVFQFWIKPEDLADRRFDRAEMTLTGY